MVGSQKGSGTVRGPWTELARWRARRKSVGRNCVARRGKDSVGRVRVNWGIELSSRPVELTAVGS